MKLSHNADITKHVLSMEKRDEIQDSWLKERLDNIIIEAMDKAELTLWITISKEYNEDPLVDSLTPRLHDETRRLGFIIFHYNKENQTLNRYWIGVPHPGLNGYYDFIWDRKKEDEWSCLKHLIETINPDKIGINNSQNYAVADGLSHSLYQQLTSTLGEFWSSRLVTSEKAVIHWFLKRSPSEMSFYPFLSNLTLDIAKKALSNEVIIPGTTTCLEVVNWIRQTVLDLGLKTSFYPTIDVQRPGSGVDRLSETTIQYGDIVHIDIGLTYLGISTDMQQLAYVLKPNEKEVPTGLKEALKKANQFSDIVMSHFKVASNGNEIFERSIQDAQEQSLSAMLYSHPVGVHCHEVGPTIGLFDRQERIPIRGDLEVIEHSAYALEFNIKSYIPEWNQETFIYLEQPIAILNQTPVYLCPRQEEFYIIN
ncbi:M24 family metallopeptidase [Evansella sp. AB-rgal1]|uniref:M24 family metallopeptidase n=1 Tax=Evansella sp. AB-rgal1 TaxID=3242696 RepID=UPI00359DC2EB